MQEERLELTVFDDGTGADLKACIKALKEAHPYEGSPSHLFRLHPRLLACVEVVINVSGPLVDWKKLIDDK